MTWESQVFNWAFYLEFHFESYQYIFSLQLFFAKHRQILEGLPSCPNGASRRFSSHNREIQIRTFEQTKNNSKTPGIATLKMVLSNTSDSVGTNTSDGRQSTWSAAYHKSRPSTTETSGERKGQEKQLALLSPYMLEREERQEEQKEPSYTFLSGMWLAGTSLMQQG